MNRPSETTGKRRTRSVLPDLEASCVDILNR